MRKINFNWLEWTLEFRNDDIRPDDEEITLGHTDYHKQKIVIRDDMSYELTYQTVLHELTHACLFSYGFTEGAFSVEELCNFVGAHGEKISFYAQDIMLERSDKDFPF